MTTMPKFMPDQQYYDAFEYDGWNLSLMNELLQGQIDLKPELAADVRTLDRARFLMLGSATVRNIDNLAVMDRILRPGQGAQDAAVIIDRANYPLEKHKKQLEWYETAFFGKDTVEDMAQANYLPYPQFSVAKADMRQLPFPDGSMDVVVSDYTLNFLQKPSDIRATLQQVSRVLGHNGMFLASVAGHPDWSHSDPVPDEHAYDGRIKLLQGGYAVTTFPAATYTAIAAEAGLHLADGVYIQTDLVSGVFRKQSPAPSPS
jgi:SAM-dependent methyltransferase